MEDKLAKVRAEIERRYKYNKEHENDWAGTSHFWQRKEDKEILSFIDSMQEEPVSEDLEKELSRLLKDCEIDSEYIHQDFLHIVANHFADWQKEQMMAKAVDVTIAIPYSNGYGGYTQLVDSQEALPFGENIKVLVIKED